MHVSGIKRRVSCYGDLHENEVICASIKQRRDASQNFACNHAVFFFSATILLSHLHTFFQKLFTPSEIVTGENEATVKKVSLRAMFLSFSPTKGTDSYFVIIIFLCENYKNVLEMILFL